MGNEFSYQPFGSLEKEPDKLTIKRLEELFVSCLSTNKIDLDADKQKQVEELLKSRPQYIALIKNGQYDSMLKQTDGERLILKELFNQSKASS